MKAWTFFFAGLALAIIAVVFVDGIVETTLAAIGGYVMIVSVLCSFHLEPPQETAGRGSDEKNT